MVPDDYAYFVEHARKLADVLRNAVFTDKVLKLGLEFAVGFDQSTAGLVQQGNKGEPSQPPDGAYHSERGESKPGLFHHSPVSFLRRPSQLGKSYYKQTVGIPQGSILSSILCSFFYGDLEEKKMMYHRDPNCVRHRVQVPACYSSFE